MAPCGRLVIGPARPIHSPPERVTNPLQVDNLPHMPAASVAIFARLNSLRRHVYDLEEHRRRASCWTLHAPNKLARPRLYVAEESGKEPMAYQTVNPSTGE